MSRAGPHNERMRELIADMATGDLSEQDARELRGFIGRDGGVAGESMELAAAEALLAMREADGRAADAPPPEAMARLRAAADAFCAGVEAAEPAPARRVEPASERSTIPQLQWTDAPRTTVRRTAQLAIAAMIAAAVSVAIYLAARPSPPTPLERRAELMSQAADVAVLQWKDWPVDASTPPEVRGVQGDVVWSDQAQTGYMRLVGLPANDVRAEQYQLWIVDADRGMDQRISGAVFNGGPGEIVVPIEPKLGVVKAAAFAITIERSGGTWVSDMKRRVVIAQR